MIVEHYPNPNKPLVKVWPHYHYPKATTAPVGGGVAEKTIMANGHGEAFNKHWADKMGLALDVYVMRDKLIQDAAQGITFEKNAVVYPKKAEDYQRLGKCRVLSVLRSYRDWDPAHEWIDAGHLYVIEAYSEENKFSVFRATAGYFTIVEPLTITKDKV